MSTQFIFDISKKTHKTEGNKRITCWFVLIKKKGAKKWLNVEKKLKRKKKLKKEEDRKIARLFNKLRPS